MQNIHINLYKAKLLMHTQIKPIYLYAYTHKIYKCNTENCLYMYVYEKRIKVKKIVNKNNNGFIILLLAKEIERERKKNNY